MIAVAIAALLPVLAADGMLPAEYDTTLTGGLQPASETLVEAEQLYI